MPLQIQHHVIAPFAVPLTQKYISVPSHYEATPPSAPAPVLCGLDPLSTLTLSLPHGGFALPPPYAPDAPPSFLEGHLRTSVLHVADRYGS